MLLMEMMGCVCIWDRGGGGGGGYFLFKSVNNLDNAVKIQSHYL